MLHWIKLRYYYIRFRISGYRFAIWHWWNMEKSWLYYIIQRKINYIPKNEFHRCLNLNFFLMSPKLGKKRLDFYSEDLAKRRAIRHQQDFKPFRSNYV